ncbi:hydantoinase B/oxoprolinase family protein [Roseomonas sp. E05]|uniref:hydantoinase B/oxoprolinase family protein n=1 Tax=Roseomonas sp. E05 TaxID=3046310 RepID=UPI0024BADD1D|nr:hydantoinase B/oxoprolinase family protein [Roseomonas sp. E05]MDJ0388814.1 hydantoinase B/oxoprolinase family protein [Roseomonas sp. E05]
MPIDSSRYRIGFDIGGTFTDFILLDRQTSTIRLHKCLTTPQDPSQGALAGLAELVAGAGLTLAEIGEIVHGTTLVTNALIERRGAILGLITTEGFRDVIEMGTEQRYDIYDLFLQFPDPLVPRRRRLEVPERMDRGGQVVTPLDLDAVRRAAGELVEAGAGAIAICFLHSYRNPAHEKAAAAAIREAFPGIAVSASAEVVAELWEYQRFVTTCANAYVQPLVDRYLKRLEQELWARGFRGALRLMQSDGGLVSPETARAFPIRLLESGPAGGGLATAFFGGLVGKPDIISFDMGGTTAKACMIEGGRAAIAPMMEVARLHRFKKGSGLPIKAPVIDMIEIGAGGGSIASIDEVGLLKVGPRSAGADPGPACYGRGGTEPTVTDANLMLGYYDPGFFLGGRMALDQPAAEAALARVGTQLGLSAVETAWGIHRTVTESMAAAARIHIVEKGKDPRRYAMVGFGGAGPAHAVEVARILGVEEVLIPPASGAASALGFLAAPLAFEQVRSLPLALDDPGTPAAIERVLTELAAETTALLVAAGTAPADISVERSADMRLAGQLHEINVPLPRGAITAERMPSILAAFRDAYAARYASIYEGVPAEIISFRARAVGPAPALSVAEAGRPTGGAARKGSRRAWFGDAFHDTPVYDRYALAPGETLHGPAIIEEREATTVLGPEDSVTVGAAGTLRIRVGVSVPLAARITPEMPLEEARALIEADPVSLEIMWSRLENLVEEMWHGICRTAFSLIVSEAQDFACDLLDAQGESLAHSPRAMPVFNLTLPRAVKAMLEKFPAETLRPGDVLITNDPWLCAGHLFDIAIVTPVFHGGRMVALLGTVGHVGDIGGVQDPMAAREVYDEGLQIPPMKLYSEGRPNAALFELMAENVRKSEEVLGDLHAFMAANAQAAERLLAFMQDYGMHDLRALAAVVQGRAERAMREAIRALPDGVYHSEVSNRMLGRTLRYPLKLTVSGDSIELDFEGAPPQLERGGLNCTLSYTVAHASYPIKCMLSPQVRGNAGSFYPISAKAPEGSLLNCTRPASVAMRTRTGWYLAPNVFHALSEAAPAQVQAHTGLPVSVRVFGKETTGRSYADHFFMGGGQGGSAGTDGKSALLWPTSAANTSIELFETRAPVLIVEKSLVADSGGPGRRRGGLGTRTRMRKLHDDGQPTLFSVYPEGVEVEAPGLFGGLQGGAALGAILDAGGGLLRDLGTGELVTLTDSSRMVEVRICGGSGYGAPEEREPARVEEDVRDGYVSREGAAVYTRPQAAE